MVPRTGMVKNTSVRARQFIAAALRGFPFKGVGVSRAKVRCRLVKVHHRQTKTPPLITRGAFYAVCTGRTKNPSGDASKLAIPSLRSLRKTLAFSLRESKAPVRVKNPKDLSNTKYVVCVEVECGAKVGERVQGGHFIPLYVMGNRLLTDVQLLC